LRPTGDPPGGARPRPPPAWAETAILGVRRAPARARAEEPDSTSPAPCCREHY
jgi:hypothetical protein